MPAKPQIILEACAEPVLLAGADQKIIWRNQAAVKILGPPSKIRYLNDFLTPQESNEIMHTRSFRSLEAQLRLPSGGVIPQTLLSIDVSAAEPDSRSILIILSSDLPEHGGLSQREEFLINVAHDLKNPLGAIFGFADALLDTAAGAGLNARQKEVLERIRRTALRCVDMVRNYQLLFDLHSPAVEKLKKRCELNQIVRSVIEYSWRSGSNSPSLELKLAKEQLPVNLERVSAERVVSNLFSNAMRYTPAGGKIAVQTKREAGWVVFSVNNSSPVISAEDLPHVFERRVRAASSDGTSGTGLGLFIARHIVESAGGIISAESSQAQGTTFTVKLPYAP